MAEWSSTLNTVQISLRIQFRMFLKMRRHTMRLGNLAVQELWSANKSIFCVVTTQFSSDFDSVDLLVLEIATQSTILNLWYCRIGLGNQDSDG